MDLGLVFSQAIAGINWIWFAIAVVAAFLVGALWYSLIWYNTWVRVFRLTKNGVTEGLSMVRSFAIQAITGTMFGFLIFVLAQMALWLAVFGVLTIAGWQMCTITFKYASAKDFWTATCVEGGYTLVAGVIYILLSLL